jgi:hypothetical protein
MADTLADRAALRRAANIICDRAQTIAAKRSRRIPAATHVLEDQGIVKVKTEGSLAPNAAPFEAGELHPLWAHVGSYRYDHYKWGRQPFFPYMMEAALEKVDDAAQAYGDSVYDYAIQRGWH